MVVPSDTQKKSLLNCGIALKYLRQAGVSLLDEDGTEIIGEDIVSGDKELTLSLLWNMFVNLQVGDDLFFIYIFLGSSITLLYNSNWHLLLFFTLVKIFQPVIIV